MPAKKTVKAAAKSKAAQKNTTAAPAANVMDSDQSQVQIDAAMTTIGEEEKAGAKEYTAEFELAKTPSSEKLENNELKEAAAVNAQEAKTSAQEAAVDTKTAKTAKKAAKKAPAKKAAKKSAKAAKADNVDDSQQTQAEIDAEMKIYQEEAQAGGKMYTAIEESADTAAAKATEAAEEKAAVAEEAKTVETSAAEVADDAKPAKKAAKTAKKAAKKAPAKKAKADNVDDSQQTQAEIDAEMKIYQEEAQAGGKMYTAIEESAETAEAKATEAAEEKAAAVEEAKTVETSAAEVADDAKPAKKAAKTAKKAAKKAPAKKAAKADNVDDSQQTQAEIDAEMKIYQEEAQAGGKMYTAIEESAETAEAKATEAAEEKAAVAEEVKAVETSAAEVADDAKPAKKAAKTAKKAAKKAPAKKAAKKAVKAEEKAPLSPEMASRAVLAAKSVRSLAAQNVLAAASAKQKVKPAKKAAKKAAAKTEAAVFEPRTDIVYAGLPKQEGVDYAVTVEERRKAASAAARAALASVRRHGQSDEKPELTEEKIAFYDRFAPETLLEMANALGLELSMEALKEDLATTRSVENTIEELTAQAVNAADYDFAEDGFDVTVIPYLARKVAASLPFKMEDMVVFADKIAADTDRILINEGINDSAVYNDLFDDVRNILVFAQKNDLHTLAEVEKHIPADLEALLRRFMKVARTILPGWQYNDVKYYEGFLYGVLSQFEDMQKLHNDAMMDIADLYILHGDYAKGDADYNYVLRENQLKDQIYYRYANVYVPVDLGKAKAIAQWALQVVDGRYDYYPRIIEILNK